MKKICLEKQLNLLEKLIVLSLTGFGAQAWGGYFAIWTEEINQILKPYCAGFV